MHQVLLPVSIMCLVILLLIFLLRRFNQPYLFAYIIAGVILGPQVTGIFSSATQTASLGELGILLLMFFLGIEINIPDKRNDLRVPIVAQLIRTILSLAFALIVGRLLQLSFESTLLIAILLVFNSTAVVSEFLRKNAELQTLTGKTALNILVLQDLLIGPVLTMFQFVGNNDRDPVKIGAASAGCLFIFLMLRAIRNRNLFQFFLIREIKDDHELQVFAGALICLGFALLASVAGLTPGIGSFIAGIYIGRTEAFNWLENTLRPFKVFFVALFFLSIGLSIDLAYFRNNYNYVILLTLLVLLINSLVSAVVFRSLGFRWQQSIYLGALLSQTGEFGILACSLAHELTIIDDTFFKGALAVTGLSLLCSTVWMAVVRKFIYTKQFRVQHQN